MPSVEQSWEECVNQVCMAGSPPDMQNLKANWQIWQRRLGEIHQELEDFKTNVAQSFRGSVADAYQERLKSIKDDITKMGETHRPIEGLLDTAATSLANAQNEMPVPSDMINDIRERPRLVSPGEFRESLSTSWLQDLGAKYADLGGEVVGKFDRALDWFTDDNKEKANQILATLNDTQFREAGSTSDAAAVDPKRYTSSEANPYGNTDPNASISGKPSVGSGVSGVGAKSFDPSASSFDPPGSGTGSLPDSGGANFGSGSGGVGSGGFPSGSGGVGSGGIGSGSGFDPSAGSISADDWSGTALAGAGGPSSSGLGGLGSPGLGPGAGGPGLGGAGLSGGPGGGVGGGAGLGAGGLDAAGMGGGLAGGVGGRQVGKGVSMPKGAGGLTSAGIGRGGAAAGSGMMGGGGLGHGGADGPTRDSWLHEDEDVWGTGSGNSSNWSFGDS